MLLIAAIFVLISFENEQWMARRYKHTRTQTSLSCVCVSCQDAPRWMDDEVQIRLGANLLLFPKYDVELRTLPDPTSFTLSTAHAHITLDSRSTATHQNRCANNSCKSVKGYASRLFCVPPPSRSNQEQLTRCRLTSRANHLKLCVIRLLLLELRLY